MGVGRKVGRSPIGPASRGISPIIFWLDWLVILASDKILLLLVVVHELRGHGLGWKGLGMREGVPPRVPFLLGAEKPRTPVGTWHMGSP